MFRAWRWCCHCGMLKEDAYNGIYYIIHLSCIVKLLGSSRVWWSNHHILNRMTSVLRKGWTRPFQKEWLASLRSVYQDLFRKKRRLIGKILWVTNPLVISQSIMNERYLWALLKWFIILCNHIFEISENLTNLNFLIYNHNH